MKQSRNAVNKGFVAIVGIALCTITFLGIRSQFTSEKPKIQTSSGRKIAVYIEDDEGVHQPNEDGKFPTDGYVLNTEKSGCANGGVLSQNPETKTISLSVSGSDQCHVYFDKEKTVNEFANMLIAKANDVSITDYNSGNKGEMFTFDHTATGQVSTWSTDELRDYRYIGSNPNNYITFNDETWRIIGVFTVEVQGQNKPQQLVKIIRDESIGDLKWNSIKVNDAYTNEWTGGSLQTMLNNTYLNTGGSFTYENVTIVKGLSATARSQIAKVKYYLGASNIYEYLGGPDYYVFERGTTTCATAGNCSGQTRETSIMQSVGLMYPSDYIYTYANGVDETCYNNGYNCGTSTPTNGWLFNSSSQWTQSPSAGSTGHVFYAYNTGYLGGFYGVSNTSYGVRPTVYLASNILIEGTGEQGNPYTIKLS